MEEEHDSTARRRFDLHKELLERFSSSRLERDAQLALHVAVRRLEILENLERFLRPAFVC